MRFSLFALASAFTAAVTAYTPPDYSKDPSGNAVVKPGLDEQVPVGEPYEVTWEPSTKGKISLVLLRGPPENMQAVDTLAESIDNSGSFSWTPSTELAPDTSHYGILLVVEGTGQYQYSTQFGIENPDKKPSSGSSSQTAEPTAPTKIPEPEPEPETTQAPVTTPSGTLVPISTMTTTICDCSTGADVVPTPSSPSSNIVQPSPTNEPPPFDGAAGRNSVGLTGGAVVALAALAAF